LPGQPGSMNMSHANNSSGIDAVLLIFGSDCELEYLDCCQKHEERFETETVEYLKTQ
jgi:hypothetical protein